MPHRLPPLPAATVGTPEGAALIRAFDQLIKTDTALIQVEKELAALPLTADVLTLQAACRQLAALLRHLTRAA